MTRASELYEKLNQAWKQTCKIILGGGVGELGEYEELLSWAVKGDLVSKPSALSGKETFVPYYYEKLPVAKLSEIDTAKDKLRRIKLGINEIKDIDTIVERLKEEFLYVGSTVLGKSFSVERSSGVVDSQHVLNSYDVMNSKFVAYSAHIRSPSYVFGSRIVGTGQFVVLSLDVGGDHILRAFEAYEIEDSSDVYYSADCHGCQDIFFSFFQNGLRYGIGNLALSPDKYKRIKEKLLEDIRENLKAGKHVRFFDLVPEKQDYGVDIKSLPNIKNTSNFDKEKINKAFRKTAKLLLNKDLEGNMDEYVAFLTKDTPYYSETGEKPIRLSPIIKAPIYLSGFHEGLFPERAFKGMVHLNEGYGIGRLHLDEREVKDITLRDVKRLRITLSPIFAYALDYIDPYTRYYDEASTIFYKAMYVYRSSFVAFSKYTAFSARVGEGSYQFGSALTLRSEFGINVYNGWNVKRGFEVDSIAYSSDIYFSHNCEGSSDVMFCFNGKGQRNSIGHNQLPREKYLEVKAALLEQIWSELNTKKDFRYGIYSLVREE